MTRLKCAISHLHESGDSKIFPGASPSDPISKGRERVGREGQGKGGEGEQHKGKGREREEARERRGEERRGEKRREG
jgi:hypothetical protein